MSQEYHNQTNIATIKENDIEANPNLNNYSNIEEEEEVADYNDSKEFQNKNEKFSSHSKHSSHRNDNEYDSGSTYSYSTGSNLIRLSQPSSAVDIHISGSSAASNNSKKNSKKKNEQSSGYYLHFEPSTIERDLNSDKVFNSGNRSKKSPKHHSQQQQQQQAQKRPQQQVQKRPQQQAQPINQQQPRQIQLQNSPQQIPQYQQRQIQPQQKQQPKNPKRQQNLIDDSPDSYQISDKYVDRDVNFNNNDVNDSNEYTYEYFSESDSYYQRNLRQVQLQMQRQQQLQQQQQPSPLQQQRKPNTKQRQQGAPSANLEDDEYTYVYEYPTSEVESQYTYNSRSNSGDKNNNGRSPHNYNNNVLQKPSNNNNNGNYNSYEYEDDDDDEYTYTYDSISGLNSDNQNKPSYQQQRPRAIDAELIPQNAMNRGVPLMPIQMQLRVPETPQLEQESTNDYTYTYDEPTTEEKLLMESIKARDSPLPSPNQSANNYQISNIPQVEIAPIETKKKPNTNKSPKPSKSKKNKKMISPRKKQLQDKISKLQKNLDKLENASYDEIESTADANDNKKINNLKDKLAGLTGWRNSPKNGQIPSAYDTNTYTYTFEYESEVFPKKKEPAELHFKTPTVIFSVDAAEKPQTITERNFLVNDESPQKINLSISPAVQSEASNQCESRKKKAEQLQEIFELKRRLQQLQEEVNDDDEDDNFSMPSENSGVPQNSNKVRVKKRIRVAKQVKMSDDLRQTKKTPPKMKKVHKRVKIEKSTSHHHHHHHITDNSQSESSAQKSNVSNSANNYDDVDDVDFVTRDVVLDEDQSDEIYDESSHIQLLDESSSPASSSTAAALLPFTSPKSPLRLLDEGYEEEDKENDDEKQSLNVRVVDVEKVPDVDVFCIVVLDKNGEARKTKVASHGKKKVFNQELKFPILNDDDCPTRLLVLVKRQDLIKNDRLLGKAKIDLDVNALKSGEEIDQKVQLTSDAGIPTQSNVHIIISLNHITSPQESSQPTLEQVKERSIPQFNQNSDHQQINNNNKNNQQINNNDEQQNQNDDQINENDDQINNNDDRDDNGDDDEEEDGGNELRPSNFQLTSDMKNKLKIHRNNFISPKTNDESGVFILEPPSQSPFDVEPPTSSGFITDLVRSRDPTDSNSKSSKSSTTKQAQKNVNFTKSDKITYNLENDVKVNQRNVTRVVRDRDVDLDESNEYENEPKINEIKKKRRIIQKIEPNNTNEDDDDQANKEPIQIEINFASSSYHDYSGISYEGEYSVE